MDCIPLLVVGHEPDWIARQVAELFLSLPTDVQYLIVDDCALDSPACFLAIDDLLWPGLPRIVSRIAKRARRVILMSWADPVHLWVIRDWHLDGVFTFAAERERFRLFLTTKPLVPGSLDFEFRADAPGTVVTALRFLLRQVKSPLSGPPPRSIAALAERLGMDAGHLGKRSRAIGLDLTRVCSLATVRWLLLYMETFGHDDPALPARLGYSSNRSVRRFVQATLGVSIQDLADMEVAHIDGLLRAQLDPAGGWKTRTPDFVRNPTFGP